MTITIITGDCRDILPTLGDKSVHACVTSPPYFGLRDYDIEGQIGQEPTPAEYIDELVRVFREVRRVLRDDGSLWLNLGDSYAMDSKWGGSTGGKHAKGVHGSDGRRQRRFTGLPDKSLIGIPWRVALALQADGWILREDVIWHKPNPMPEPVVDRCVRAHEYLFHFSKSKRYYHDYEAVREPAVSAGRIPGGRNRYIQHSTGGHLKDGLGACAEKPVAALRNRRSVWTVAVRPFRGAHFATYPAELIKPCLLGSVPAGGTVLDPFGGAATTAVAADSLGRHALIIEMNPKSVELSNDRLRRHGGSAA